MFQFIFLLFQDGTTPLILSAAAGYLDCVKELLEQGADPAAQRIVIIFESSTHITDV